MFLGVILYTIGFVADLVVPKTIDSGETRPAFGQHRHRSDAFGYLRHPAQRDGAAGIQSLVDALRPAARWSAAPMCCLQTSPSFSCSGSGSRFPKLVWSAEQPGFWQFFLVGAVAGGLGHRSFSRTFLINHFDLFGLKQVIDNISGQHRPANRNFTRHFSTNSCAIPSISASSSLSGRRRSGPPVICFSPRRRPPISSSAHGWKSAIRSNISARPAPLTVRAAQRDKRSAAFMNRDLSRASCKNYVILDASHRVFGLQSEQHAGKAFP